MANLNNGEWLETTVGEVNAQGGNDGLLVWWRPEGTINFERPELDRALIHINSPSNLR